jgi:hypothetical protein
MIFQQVFMVTYSLDELLKEASIKFDIKAQRLFTPQGGEIDDINLIRFVFILASNQICNYKLLKIILSSFCIFILS